MPEQCVYSLEVRSADVCEPWLARAAGLQQVARLQQDAPHAAYERTLVMLDGDGHEGARAPR